MRGASIVFACFVVVALSGCGAGSEAREPVELATVTATPTTDATVAVEAAVADPEPVDPAAGLTGNRDFLKAFPTSNELADTLGALWTFDPPQYDAPGVPKQERPLLERQLALLVQPERCRAAGATALIGLTTRPAREASTQVARRPDQGLVTMEVVKFRTVEEAELELQRWKGFFRSCPSFSAEVMDQGTFPVAVQSARTVGPRLAAMVHVVAGAGGVYRPLAVERVGSALVRVQGQWSVSPQGVQLQERMSVAHTQAVVGRIVRRVTKLSSPTAE